MPKLQQGSRSHRYEAGFVAWIKRTYRSSRRRLKSLVRRCESLYLRTFRSFNQEDLLAHLKEIGLMSGDRVLVHGSFDRFGGFRGTPSDVLAALRSAVGSTGLVMMPTTPFSGLALDYALSGAVMDVRKTPSRMGILSEVFRRSPGVARSVHPTHPVAIWGADAKEWSLGHEQAKTPCGSGSPYRKLLDAKGRILFLGTGIESFTFLHTLEEIYESRLPMSPFTSKIFHLNTRDESGTLVPTATRLFDATVARLRRPERLIPLLRTTGSWRSKFLQSVPVSLLDCEGARLAYLKLCDSSAHCYDFR